MGNYSNEILKKICENVPQYFFDLFFGVNNFLIVLLILYALYFIIILVIHKTIYIIYHNIQYNTYISDFLLLILIFRIIVPVALHYQCIPPTLLPTKAGRRGVPRPSPADADASGRVTITGGHHSWTV